MHAKSEDDLQTEVKSAWRRLGKSILWTHAKTGNVYCVEKVLVREDDLVICVAYHRTGSPVTWVRPLNQFLAKFTPTRRDEQ